MSQLCRVPSARARGGRLHTFSSTVSPPCVHRQDCVEQLLKNMFDGEQTESCLVCGTQVLLSLLDTRRAG